MQDPWPWVRVFAKSGSGETTNHKVSHSTADIGCLQISANLPTSS